MTNDWKTRADAYKAHVLSCIPEEWRLKSKPTSKDVRHVAETAGILTADEVKLLARDATQLAADIAAGKFTAVQVATAYCKSAAVAHQTTNCLMDFFPEQALERAKWLDDELARTGKPVGAMHGVPISVKDMVAVKGTRMSAGFLGYLEGDGGVSAEDAVITASFRAAGAVFYCKTTNPQSIMHLECDSFLGATTNPFNTDLTPGGSTGGEAALIAAGGSVLGIGTDIGGSIRNPCANCGLYGFKPCASRLPKSGNMSGMPNQESIVGAIGPMGVSARDMEFFVKVQLDAEPWKVDMGVVKMPWRPEEVKWVGGSKPRIGVQWHDGVVVPQPPMRASLKMAVDKLKAAGYEVVEVQPRKTWEAWLLLKELFYTDGGARVRAEAARTGEPLLPLTEWILEGAREKTTTELMALIGRREAFRKDYAKYWQSLEIDVMLLPPMPGPANVLGTSKYWLYTALYNLLDYPGAVFPTGVQVDPKNPEHARDEPREYLSEDDKRTAEEYSPEKFENAPINLQIIGGHWEEERVMEALKIISKVVNP
ncbi:hypothetical protein CspeluHIS016_0114870 [Cutaneotrichosporon spelunceum]|uniref:Amidase domain-containing protein n=1 Tax=Cutaneotrichosporon spelunceum TaxID=1672016 RepID=A0AAD3TQX5_9TREE|nr:hypothetical protein CspeluHIS016_0114870 [Cutaneotrichosporon spelunceum]